MARFFMSRWFRWLYATTRWLFIANKWLYTIICWRAVDDDLIKNNRLLMMLFLVWILLTRGDALNSIDNLVRGEVNEAISHTKSHGSGCHAGVCRYIRPRSSGRRTPSLPRLLQLKVFCRQTWKRFRVRSTWWMKRRWKSVSRSPWRKP